MTTADLMRAEKSIGRQLRELRATGPGVRRVLAGELWMLAIAVHAGDVAGIWRSTAKSRALAKFLKVEARA